MILILLLIVAVIVLLIDNVKLRIHIGNESSGQALKDSNGTYGAKLPKDLSHLPRSSMVPPPSHQIHPHYYSTPMDAASPPPPVDTQSTSREYP